MRGDKMVMEGKRDWSGLIMIHCEIPELLPSLRSREPRTENQLLRRNIQTKSVKNTCHPFQLRPFIWDKQHLPQ